MDEEQSQPTKEEQVQQSVVEREVQQNVQEEQVQASEKKEVEQSAQEDLKESDKEEQVQQPVKEEEQEFVKEEVKQPADEKQEQPPAKEEQTQQSAKKEEIQQQPVKEEQVQQPTKEETKQSVPEQSNSEQVIYGKPSRKEKELFDLINEYRQQSGLKAVPFSVSLTKVAQMHARDCVENNPDVNGGNMHSWSDKGPWKAVTYTSDHKQAKLMWSKPSELTSYKSEGFEISHGYVGNARKTTETTPKVALDGWKKSEGHNNVIVEKNAWKGTNFQALGVGMYKGYACCWFGKPKDDAQLEN